MSATKVGCNFCGTKIEVEGETLPIHESEKGSGQRCDGSGLPVESMEPDKAPTGGVLTDSGNTGKDA